MRFWVRSCDLLNYPLHVATLGADDPACNLEVPLIFDLDVVSASELALLEEGAGILSSIEVLLPEALPLEALNELVDLTSQGGVVAAIVNPVNAKLPAAQSKVNKPHQLVAGVGV